jgi:hypothetical protein
VSTVKRFTVSPRDASMPFDVAHRIIADVPGARVTDVDAKNRIAVIEVPAHMSADVERALQDRFLVDPNAPLQY